MVDMEPGDENFTLPDGLAVQDEKQYQREVMNLAGHIIAGDKPEAEFDRIL